MDRRFLKLAAAALCISLALALPVQASASDGAPAVTVSGEKTDIGETAYILNGRTYVDAVELSYALGADSAVFDGTAFTAQAGGLTVSASADSRILAAGDAYYYMNDGAAVSSDKLMLPAFALCRAFGAGISWDGDSRTVSITPGDSGADNYGGSDLFWLSHIINAEAGGEELDGMIAVGNVVMNRVRSDQYPDDIYSVIFDDEFGIQFAPAYDGSIYKTPSEESVLAAQMVLDGADAVGSCLFFTADYIAATSWVGQNRPFVTQIGGQCFYS